MVNWLDSGSVGYVERKERRREGVKGFASFPAEGRLSPTSRRASIVWKISKMHVVIDSSFCLFLFSFLSHLTQPIIRMSFTLYTRLLYDCVQVSLIIVCSNLLEFE